MNQAKKTTSDLHNPAQLIAGEAMPIKYLQTYGATVGQVPTFNGTTVVWANGGGFTLPITTVLSSGTATYDQTNNFLGIPGLTGAGQTFDTGTGGVNILASLDTTPFGGSPDSTFVGYFNPFGTGNSNANFAYDAILGEAAVSFLAEEPTGNFQAGIDILADSTNSSIRIAFGGSDNYLLPNTQPTVGTVLGYSAPNVLDWVTPSASITIGNPITSGTANRILYEDASNNLAESSDFTFDDSTGEFLVATGGNKHLWINPASNQYYIGDGSGAGNTTLIEILDGTQQIRNWVNGSFVVEQPNAGPRLIDGNTTTFNLYLGDVGSFGKKTAIEILDSAQQIYIHAHASVGGSTGLIRIGDTTASGNKTEFQINDFAQQTFVQTDGDFGIQNSVGQRALNISFSSGLLAELGDINSFANSNRISVDDAAQTIRSFISGEYVIEDTANNAYFSVFPTGRLVSIGDYANNFDGTSIKVDDVNHKVTSSGKVFGTVGVGLSLDYANDIYSIGQVSGGTGNLSYLTIEDGNHRMAFTTGGVERFIVFQDWTLIGNAFVTANWQTYTGSGSVTMNNNVSGLVYNPASVNATATITLPTSSGGTGSNITIVFGGTITSGNPVVTALTIAPGAGNTIVDSAIPTTANAGDSLTYHKEGAFWYRVH